MQNSTHNNLDDKFAMNFNNFDTDALFNPAHMGGINLGLKRTAHDAGLDHREGMGLSSEDEDEDDDDVNIKKEGNINRRTLNHHHQSSSTTRGNVIQHHQTNIEDHQHHHQNHGQHHHQKQNVLPNGKKTKGRVKIKMEFIDNKLRRYTTFSKRKTGIMKKAYELSTLTGTQVMLLVASETGHVYTFATRKLQPMITSEAGKQLIQTCLNSPDPPQSGGAPHQHDQRMSATGYEETELTYAVTEEEHKVRQMIYSSSTTSSTSSSPLPFASSSSHAPLHHQISSSSNSTIASTGISTITTSSSISDTLPLPPHSVAGTLAPSPSPHQGGLASPVVSVGIQSHHHSPQYHHPPLSPHISPPISLSHTLPPHLSPTLLSQQSVISSHSEHSSGGLIGLHHHHPSSHLSPAPPQTPLPPHSPLPPVLSPMGAPSPTPSFQPTAIHHHPHHIATHTR